MGKFTDRTGEKIFNRQGLEMEIIKYRNSLDIDVEILTNPYNYIIKNCAYSQFRRQCLESPLFPTVYNIGYMGIGKYSSVDEYGNKSKIYNQWVNMLSRCYNDKYIKLRPTYEGCKVDKGFHCYQNFVEWYINNKWSKDCLNVDKDILNKGNKTYSYENCVLVDNRLNSLFCKSNAIRGKYPIGVNFDKERNKYVSQCWNGKGVKMLGRYSTPLEAFQAYKQFKESYIKQVADEYKQKYPNFPDKLYNAMYNYEVEITD